MSCNFVVFCFWSTVWLIWWPNVEGECRLKTIQLAIDCLILIVDKKQLIVNMKRLLCRLNFIVAPFRCPMNLLTLMLIASPLLNGNDCEWVSDLAGAIFIHQDFACIDHVLLLYVRVCVDCVCETALCICLLRENLMTDAVEKIHEKKRREDI